MKFSLAHLFILMVALRHLVQILIVKDAGKNGHVSGFFPTLVMAGCYLTCFICAATSLWGKTEITSLFVIGFCVMELFIFIRIIALEQLGRNFSYQIRTSDSQRLVTNGVYGIIRHPLHLAFVGEVAGMAIIWSTGAALLIAVALLPVITYRNRIEDAALEERFGDEFREYKKRVPGMVPVCGGKTSR